MRQALQIPGGEQSKCREHQMQNLRGESAWPIQCQKTSNARGEDKGEKSRSEGHEGSGIDCGVKLMQ